MRISWVLLSDFSVVALLRLSGCTGAAVLSVVLTRRGPACKLTPVVIGRIVLLLHHRTEGLSVLMAMLRSLLPGSNHRAAYPRVAGFPESTSKWEGIQERRYRLRVTQFWVLHLIVYVDFIHSKWTHKFSPHSRRGNYTRSEYWEAGIGRQLFSRLPTDHKG